MLGTLVFAAVAEPQPIWPGFGINIHFTTPQPGEMALLKSAGFQYVRMDFHWAATEKVKGQYDFSAYDGLLKELKTARIRPLFILDYGNDLYQPGPPTTLEARAAFARWAAAAASRYRGEEIVWEIWNEPNISMFWQPHPSPEDYARLALAAARAVKKADPSARLIAPGTSTIDINFLAQGLTQEILGLIDGVSVHPYRTDSPETAWEEFGRLRGLIREAAPPGRGELPIISSEWGYTTTDVPEAVQAAYLGRMMLVNRAAGIPLSIFYDWKNDGPDPKEREHRFGVVTEDLKPKPSYLAAKNLLSELKGLDRVRRVEAGPGRWKVEAAGARRAVAYEWSLEPSSPPEQLRLTEAEKRSIVTRLSRDPASEADLPPVRFDNISVGLLPPFQSDQWTLAVTQVIPKPSRISASYGGEDRSRRREVVEAKGARSLLALPGSRLAQSFTLQEEKKAAVTTFVKAESFLAADFQAILYPANQAQPPVPVEESEQGMAYTYAFPQGWCYAGLSPKAPLEIPAGAKKLTLWLKSDGTRNPLRCRVRDESGQVFQYDLGLLDEAGAWTAVVINFEARPGGFWGGAKTGKHVGKRFWDTLLLIDSGNWSSPRGGRIVVGPGAYSY